MLVLGIKTQFPKNKRSQGKHLVKKIVLFSPHLSFCFAVAAIFKFISSFILVFVRLIQALAVIPTT